MKDELNFALASVFGRQPLALRQRPTAYVTTFPCQIVTCRIEPNETLGLFCKYGPRDGGCSYGQRRGVDYEAEVYRRVLHPSGFSTPHFYGSYTDPRSGGTWLVLENLKASQRAGKVPRLRAMKLAARWIGQFQAVHEADAANHRVSFLTKYNAPWYRAWSRRAFYLARRYDLRLPWLAAASRSLEQAIGHLDSLPRTVIHGEYYPHNIMFQSGRIRPVDWETAAIAPGEIDLATLTEGWSAEDSRLLEAEYCQARWPAGAPGDFERNLTLARAFIEVRWLGDDDPEKSTNMTRWKRLHDLAQRLQIIPRKERVV